MKKARIIAVMAALIVSLSGCVNTDHPQTIQDSSSIETVTREVDEGTVSDETPTYSFSESEESLPTTRLRLKQNHSKQRFHGLSKRKVLRQKADQRRFPR